MLELVLEALYDLTSGADNISVGYRSAYNVTTGAKNIAIGSFALTNPDTEDSNLAIGYNSMSASIAGGEDNVAIGNYHFRTFSGCGSMRSCWL